MIELGTITPDLIEDMSTRDLGELHKRCHEYTAEKATYDDALLVHDFVAIKLDEYAIEHVSPLERIAVHPPLIRGLYLVAPHGKLVADGRKTAIAKAKYEQGSKLHDLEGDWVLVSKDNGEGRAYGGISLDKPDVVDRDEFNARFDEHRVTEDELERWWSGKDRFYLYSVREFKPYSGKPRSVEIPAGVQTVMRVGEQTKVGNPHTDDNPLDKVQDLPDKFVWIPDFDVGVILRADLADTNTLGLTVGNAFVSELRQTFKGMDKSGQTLAGLYDLCLVRKLETELVRQQYKAVGGEEKDILDSLAITDKAVNRSRCMQCKELPIVDVQWASGRGRVWFCLRHFKDWIAESEREIVRAWYLSEGEVPKKIGDDSSAVQIRKLGGGLDAVGVLKRLEKFVTAADKGGPGSGWHGPPEGTHTTRGLQSRLQVYHGGEVSKQEIEAMREEIQSTWEGKRKTYALGGFGSFDREGRDTIVGREGDELVSIAALSNLRPSDEISDHIPAGNYRYVMTAATKRSGYGRQLMEGTVQQAKESQTGLILISDPGAAGFYRKIGMHEVGPIWDNAFYWTPEEIQTKAKKEKQLSLEELEPEDGVFVEELSELMLRQYALGANNLTTGDKAFSGVIIALFVPIQQATQLGLNVVDVLDTDSVEPYDMHITLAYLGDKADLSDKHDAIQLVLENLAQKMPVIKGRVGGIGKFNTLEDGNVQAVCALFDAPTLAARRETLIDALDVVGIQPASDHGFTPHITLGYVPVNNEVLLPEVGSMDIIFGQLTLAWGEERYEYPLVGVESAKAVAGLDVDELTELHRLTTQVGATEAVRALENELIVRVK